MTWFKIDDGFHGHPKVIMLPLEAVGLWAIAGTWCADYLTDGDLPMGAMLRLGGTVELADLLVEHRLWVRTETGYRFREWEPYQPTKEQVLADRDAARSRMKRARGGSRSGEVRANTKARSENVRANFDGTSEEVRLPRPDPSNSSSNEELSTSDDANASSDAGGGEVALRQGVSEPEAFAAFWDRYPRKVGKAAAEKAFGKALRRATAEDILRGLENFIPAALTRDRQFIPHPTTWLNRDGWWDEVDAEKTPGDRALSVMQIAQSLQERAGRDELQ